MVTLVILAILAACSAGWWSIRRRREIEMWERIAPIPLISFAREGESAHPIPPPARRNGASARSSANTYGSPTLTSDIDDEEDDARFAPAPPAPAPVASRAPSRAVRHAVDGNVMLGPAVEGHSVRFHRPMEGTLQFLPGRLEIVEGGDEGHEIRFVKTFGLDGNQITFGRDEGPVYRHVQLRAPTVSRQHARMRFADGAWALTNLSRTNPVAVNGDELDASDGTVVLADGDRIEMGEVVFRFRER